MDLFGLLPYISVANFILTWGVGFYVHIVNKNKATNDRIATLETQMHADTQAHSIRLARLENTAQTAPTHSDLGKVYDQVNKLAQSSSRMEGQLDGMNDTLRLILHRVAEKGMQ